MKKALNIITAALFFTFVCMFAVSTFILSKEKPPKPTERSFPKLAEDYVRKSFPLMANWRSLYSTMITAAGQNMIGSVYVSDNGLIEIISKADDKKVAEKVTKINDFAARHERSNIFVLVVPTASGIYSQQLPMIINALDQQKLIDDLYFSLDGRIQTLDAYNPLFSARDDYVYFRTDDRWTEYGAYTVYSKVIRKLGFSPLGLSSYDLEYADRDFYGDLYKETYCSTVRSDFINIFRNKNGSFVTSFSAISDGEKFNSSSIYYTPALATEDKLDVFLGGNSFERYTIKTSNSDAPRLLMIKGRYANMFVPFLTPHYSEITLIDPEQLTDKSIEDLVDVDSYDQILMLYDVSQFC